MNPWWTDQQAGLYGGMAGSAFGLIGGMIGTIAGIYAPRGKCKAIVYALCTVVIACGTVALLAGLAAVLLRQPVAVYLPLLLIGGVGVTVVGGVTPVIVRGYRQADHRRLEAEQLRRG